MLILTIKSKEQWDEVHECFIPQGKDQTIALEHSLVSISKWEMKHKKPFLTKEQKTIDEMIDYVRCMTLTQNVDENLYYSLTADDWEKINNYINDPATATTFKDDPRTRGRRSSEIITSELVYYWMIAYNIPKEFEKWHFNRLSTLIRICSIKNAEPEKRSRADMLAERRALNASRRAKYHTKG